MKESRGSLFVNVFSLNTNPYSRFTLLVFVFVFGGSTHPVSSRKKYGTLLLHVFHFSSKKFSHTKNSRRKMSIPDGNPSSSYDQSSSSWRRRMNSFPPGPTRDDKNKVEESDEDLFTVPDMEARLSDSAKANESEAQQNNNSSSVATGKRRRGRNPADREYRRLKRLLRNRVSAQQARERKKVYVNDLESKAKDLQDMNSKLEEKISTLINENTMLRKVLMNTRPKVDESTESKHDQTVKS